MVATFEQKFKLIKKWSNRVILPLGAALVVLSFLVEGFSAFFGWALIVFVGIIHCMWFVPTGYVGFATIFGKLRNKSFSDGLSWVIPFVTDCDLMDTRRITISRQDIKTVKSLNTVTIDYSLAYQLNPQYVHIVFKTMGVDYWNKHMFKKVDGVFDTVVNQLSYLELQYRKGEIETICSQLIEEAIDKECSQMSSGAIRGGRSVKRYTIDHRVESVHAAEDPSKIIDLEMIYLNEYDELVDGVNFFKFVNLTINHVKFEDEYEQAVARVAVARAKTVEAEELSKQMEIQANARKKAHIIEAEGQAQAMKLKGESENEIKKALGDILKNNPDLIKDKLAEHFPQVLGGNVNPMMTIESTAGHS